jgi:hypothetical protein
MTSYLIGVTIPIDGGSMAAQGFQRGTSSGEWSLLQV